MAAAVAYRFTTDLNPDGSVKFPFPAQIEDAKCAVRFLRAKASVYHIDPTSIGAMGTSAGGHLALLLGLTANVASLEGTGGNPQESSAVQAVVNWSGPTDLASLYTTTKAPNLPESIVSLIGGVPSMVPAKASAASPVSYVSSAGAPVITFHGKNDTTVPYAQATLLDTTMLKQGASHTLVGLIGVDHDFNSVDVVARGKTFAFLDQKLK